MFYYSRNSSLVKIGVFLLINFPLIIVHFINYLFCMIHTKSKKRAFDSYICNVSNALSPKIINNIFFVHIYFFFFSACRRVLA